MAALPTSVEIKAIRQDVSDYLSGKLLSDFSAQALAEFKRRLEDSRGILWTQVYDTTTDDYFTERNADRCKYAIALLTVGLIFEGYAMGEENRWLELANYFYGKFDKVLETAKLDVDLDEDGAIDEAEEAQTGQVFFRR